MENCSNSTGVEASLRLTEHFEKRGYCFLSAVAMRRDPSDRAEMVNQLLQGDTFTILEQQEKWTLAKCDWDGYEGWIDNKQWRPTEDEANISAGSEESPASVAESTYLGAPYLWGGRTIMGIDCSGLTQVCFRACGKRLLRDASQQAGILYCADLIMYKLPIILYTHFFNFQGDIPNWNTYFLVGIE